MAGAERLDSGQLSTAFRACDYALLSEACGCHDKLMPVKAAMAERYQCSSTGPRRLRAVRRLRTVQSWPESLRNNTNGDSVVNRNTHQIERLKGPIMNVRMLAIALAACGAIGLVPQAVRSEVVVVDVVAVAQGMRTEDIKGKPVVNEKGEKIGTLDDLIIGKDRVLFAVLQVGGFLGLGSHFVAVPYQSLKITEAPVKILLPGASKDALKNLPEFKYRS
jgi:sporulation protein YlmC with PRC-barrel domain